MRTLLLVLLLAVSLQSRSQSLYFPPLLGNTWDTLPASQLGWCTERIDSLYRYLEQQNTKAFIVLKDGKRVLEKYFGTFGRDSVWYWASAGKTITAFLVGKAQEEGYLSLEDTSARYLGAGWTNCSPQQEAAIRIRNQLTMTSGLDDGVPDNHCTIDTCLNFLAPAGTRWAYHNAPYTLLEGVLESATGQPINAYTGSVLRSKTGITGQWLTVDYNNVFFSRARSMARFGLLMQNRCIWGNDTLLRDTGYIYDMLHSSQELNYAYGYLWWLNGQGSFMVPGLQTVFPGSYAPSAPQDMYAALGKNGQIISVAPSKGLVVVRMGEEPGGSEVSFLLCDNIWQRLNYLMCNSTPPQVYMFTGSGNWNVAANWQNNRIPPAVLPAGDQIVIYPFANGECILNVQQTVSSGASLVVVGGKRFRITGNLQWLQ